MNRTTVSNQTTILGISAFYHDSAAALVHDGKIVAASRETVHAAGAGGVAEPADGDDPGGGDDGGVGAALAVTYYLVFTPIGLGMRLFGRDIL